MSQNTVNSQSKWDNKFRRRTSNHNLRLDVQKAASGQSGRESNTCPCDMGASEGPKFSSAEDETNTMNLEVVEEGKHLFQNFVREEIRREGLMEPAKCFSPLCR